METALRKRLEEIEARITALSTQITTVEEDTEILGHMMHRILSMAQTVGIESGDTNGNINNESTIGTNQSRSQTKNKESETEKSDRGTD